MFSTALRTGSILFCRHGFKGQYRQSPRPRRLTRRSPIPTYPRKAGYATHSTRFCAPQCRFNPASYAVRVPADTERLSHKSRSPRKPGRSVYAVTPRPETLTPSTHPDLGEKSKHQGLHRYALKRITTGNIQVSFVGFFFFYPAIFYRYNGFSNVFLISKRKYRKYFKIMNIQPAEIVPSVPIPPGRSCAAGRA